MVVVEHYVNNQKVKALVVHIPGKHVTLSDTRVHLQVVVGAYMYTMSFCRIHIM